MPVSPKVSANRSHSSVERRAGRRHGDHVHAGRVELAAPAGEDVGDLLDPPEPGGQPALALGVADLLEELRVAERAPVLDVLLPLGRDLADQVTRGEHHVDLGVGVAERLEGAADLGAGGGGQDLVADDRGAVEAADPFGQRVPGADGLLLEASPRQPHQVEGGQEVPVEPVGGVEDAARLEVVTVPEQHVLEVRRARLGGADVQQDPRRAHRSTSLAPAAPVASCLVWSFVGSAVRVRSSARSATSRTPAPVVAAGSSPLRGSNEASSPCTGYPARDRSSTRRSARSSHPGLPAWGYGGPRAPLVGEQREQDLVEQTLVPFRGDEDAEHPVDPGQQLAGVGGQRLRSGADGGADQRRGRRRTDDEVDAVAPDPPGPALRRPRPGRCGGGSSSRRAQWPSHQVQDGVHPVLDPPGPDVGEHAGQVVGVQHHDRGAEARPATGGPQRVAGVLRRAAGRRPAGGRGATGRAAAGARPRPARAVPAPGRRAPPPPSAPAPRAAGRPGRPAGARTVSRRGCRRARGRAGRGRARWRRAPPRPGRGGRCRHGRRGR